MKGLFKVEMDPFPPGMLQEWEAFLSEYRPVEAIFATDTLFPLQRPRELLRMMAAAAAIKPTVGMEIGSDKAGSVWAWLKSVPTLKRFIACEIRGVPYKALLTKAFPHIDFLWLAESSYATAIVQQVSDWLGPDKIDCLFIDGDKAAFDTDFDAYLPMMNPKGIVFMHDITDPSPGQAYRKVCDRGYIHEEIVDIQDSLAAMKREEAGIPPGGSHEAWLRHWRGRSCGVGVIRL